MAKKKTAAKAATKVEVAQPEIKATNEMVEVVVKQPKQEENKPKNDWQIKDRVYYLRNNK